MHDLLNKPYLAILGLAQISSSTSPMLTVIKSIALLLLLFCGGNLALAKDTPNKTTVEHEKNTIGSSHNKALQEFLAPFKDEELTDVSILFIPMFYLSQTFYETTGFNIGNEDLKLKLEDRLFFIFKVPESESLSVWHQVRYLAFQDKDSKPHPYLNFILSIRFTFADKVLYVSAYRENKTSLSLATEDQRIFLTLESLDAFADIANHYIEHPILKEALYEEIQP